MTAQRYARNLPYEEEFSLARAELWAAAGEAGWQERRRKAAAWLVARKEATDELIERTEARIARDEQRLTA